MSKPARFWLYHLHPVYKMPLLFVAGVIVFFALPSKVDFLTRIMLGWDVFSLVTVIAYWTIFLKTSIAQIKEKANAEDSSTIIIFSVVVIATLASLLAMILLVTSKDESNKAIHLVTAISGMIFSWLLVHSLFAVRYAHLYYSDDDKRRNNTKGGLDFPEDDEPDFKDFAYFSFVIGMTFQVSDVEISSKKIRRLALVHGLISFGFNTVIVALTINVIAGLGKS